MINGSPHVKGTTYVALHEMEKIFNENGIDTEILTMGSTKIRDCIGCWKCSELGKCIFDDDMINEWADKIYEADGIVVGTPIYYAPPSGQVLSLLDRLCISRGKAFEHKVTASITVGRRAGATATLDVINKHFLGMNAIVVGSSYWNLAYGRTPEEVVNDKEGLQTMRNVAKNMSWVLTAIDGAKTQGVEKPVLE